MTAKTVAAAYAAIAAIVVIAVWVVLQDSPAHDVRVNNPTSQPGTPVPQPLTGGAR